jgi:hypothetical protein
MASLRIDKAELARRIGASVRTVEGYLAGRKPSRMTQKLIESLK